MFENRTDASFVCVGVCVFTRAWKIRQATAWSGFVSRASEQKFSVIAFTLRRLTLIKTVHKIQLLPHTVRAPRKDKVVNPVQRNNCSLSPPRVAQQPFSGLGRLTVEVSRSHRHITLRRTPLDEVSAHRRDLSLTTHNIHKRLTSMPSVGFEPAIPASEPPKTYAMNRAATGIGYGIVSFLFYRLHQATIQYFPYGSGHKTDVQTYRLQNLKEGNAIYTVVFRVIRLWCGRCSPYQLSN